MFSLLRPAVAIAVFLLCVSTVSYAQQGYRTVTGARSTGAPDTVEVIEFFWYGCPHCYNFEPYIEKWKKDLPENVTFRYVPAVLSQRWELHGRAFYAAKLMGVLEPFHGSMFSALHEENRRLTSEQAIGQFVSELGIDREEFIATMNSFAVDTRIRKARDLQKDYGISGTPSIVVDGTYVTSGSRAGNFKRMIEIMNERVKQAREELPESSDSRQGDTSG
jgi:thiol:disulfide interchange protein DsbA